VVAYFLMYEITAHGGIVGLTWLAGRIYANAALRLGARVGFRDALHGRGRS
jgi:hypothetical protein